ncbi:MAG: hypothetical protein K2H43_06190 [Clostridia bacterium]|nr:hypothetical protein [Clostridia bacterium]
MQKRVFWKGFLLAAGVLCVLLALCGCSVQEMSTLPELSKPYLGIYECETLRIGDTDFCDRFEYLNVELKYSGDFVLSYRGTDGNQTELSGKYKADPEAGEITFSARTGLRNSSFTFPLQEGKITVDYNFGGKLLHAVFASP